MRRSAKAIVLAASIGLGVSLSATPASAASSDCPGANYFCVWKDANYGSTWFGAQNNYPDWSFGFTSMINNDSSSWNQKSSGTAVIYDGKNYVSRTVCVAAGTALAHHYSSGDKGNSHKSVSGGCPSV